jgi:dolichol-phosphate mannosyltransferase
VSGIALSVVLPTLNERENIIPLLERIEASLADIGHEIIVVDDASPDGTAAVVATYAATHPAVRVHRRDRRGLTSAIQDGIDRTQGAAVAWMDCDLSMPPETLPKLYAALDAADVAIGSRYAPGGEDARADVPLHRALSRVLNAVLRLLLGARVSDYTTGFVCARRHVLDAVRLSGDYGEYCIDFLHRAGRTRFRIAEVPYRNTPRARGSSKTATSALGLLVRGTTYLTTSARLLWRYGR